MADKEKKSEKFTLDVSNAQNVFSDNMALSDRGDYMTISFGVIDLLESNKLNISHNVNMTVFSFFRLTELMVQKRDAIISEMQEQVKEVDKKTEKAEKTK